MLLQNSGQINQETGWISFSGVEFAFDNASEISERSTTLSNQKISKAKVWIILIFRII
jgi:hypothetical protein